MKVQTNIALRDYTTMHLGGNAHFLAEAHSSEELAALYRNAKKMQQPTFIIGGGSNLIVHDEGFNGLAILNRIPGFEVINDNEKETTIKIGAGEIWDSVVERVVTMNLTGVEALSGHPPELPVPPRYRTSEHTVKEIADTLLSVEAYDISNDTFVRLEASDCGFSYRHSIFRGSEQGRYAITAIILKLYKQSPQPPFYDSLQKYLDDNHIIEYTPLVIRNAVIAIRSNKLPDPRRLPNSGSFFKNAIVEKWQLTELQEAFPDIPSYEMDPDHYKIPTGWLIEQVDLKGELLHGMRVHSGNAVVVIDESAKNYEDLASAREEIINAVRDKFRITIEQEPLEL